MYNVAKVDFNHNRIIVSGKYLNHLCDNNYIKFLIITLLISLYISSIKPVNVSLITFVDDILLIRAVAKKFTHLLSVEEVTSPVPVN